MASSSSSQKLTYNSIITIEDGSSGLSEVIHDTTLTGNGTFGHPLSASAALAEKQNTLVPGTNIDITNNTISASVSTDGVTLTGTGSAGSPLSISNPSYYIKGNTVYGGTLTDNLNTLVRNTPFTCLGTATGVPDASYSWFGWHINSNAGTAAAAQIAYAFNSNAIICYERVKTSGTWGAWILQSSGVDVSDNQNTWYLDTRNGLDTNSGLSRSAPKKTGDAVVIACKTAGKFAGRLVVMAGTGTVTFTAANWVDATFPFSDVVFETACTECTWNGIATGGGIFKVVGGEHTFNSCACGGQVSVKADYCIVKGGDWSGIINFDIESYITVKGMTSEGELCIQTPILEIQSKFAINGTAKIQADELYGAGNFVSHANSEVHLDIQANYFSLEGNFQFSSQAANSSIKITAAKMQRTATTRLLYLGAQAGVTVNYQLVVDTMGSIVPVEIATPDGTVAGKVIELLKYENKADAEIIRATAAEALKADLVDGFVPSSQLHGYVDDVLDAYIVGSTPFASDWLSLTVGGTALTPESGKIYIILTAGIYEMLEFRWSGTVYGEISKSIALGETSSTAGRGDHTKAAYDHSLLTSGNPHGVTKSDVGLGNVDNVSDANKPVSTATQAALDLKANQTAISNIDNTSDANKPVSTATQTALDLKANKLTTVNNSTDTAYTFLASDANTCHIVNTSTATTRTVPSDTTAPDIAIGDSIEVQNIGTGVVTFVAASGVTISSSLTLVMYGQYSVCMLRKIAANTWILTGERTAV